MSVESARKVLERVSPSQVESYELCPRRWYNRSILGLDPEPMSAAAQRGVDVAEGSEIFYRTGQIPDAVASGPFAHRALLEAILPHLGARTEATSVEEWVETSLPGLPTLRGRYDFLDIEPQTRVLGARPMPMLGDIKCRSSARYAKTPEELLNDTQMVAYARPILEALKTPELAVRHVYGITSGKPKAFPVTAVATLENTQARHDKTVATIREMAAWAVRHPTTADELAPNTEACSKFPPAGCPHRARCGLPSTFQTELRRTTMENNNGQSDLMKRLAEQTAKLMAVKTGTAPVAPTPPAVTPPLSIQPMDEVSTARARLAAGVIRYDAGSKQVYAKEGADAGWLMRHPTLPEQIAIDEQQADIKAKAQDDAGPRLSDAPAILPPDAPSRTAALIEVEDKPKRGRKPKVTVSVEQADGTMTPPVPVDEVATVIGAPIVAPQAPIAGSPRLAAGPVIYVNCIPVKGEHKGQGVMFEEWMAPICEVVAQEKGVVDWRLIQYTAKGDLAAKVRACISTLPPVVLVSKFSPAADVFLESVIPWASQIIQGV